MKGTMGIPLREILDFDGNAYALTNAIIKRAAQLSHTGSEDLEKFGDKIVSLAMHEVLSGKVSYRKG